MRNPFVRVALGLALIGAAASLWIIPSYAQVPGTLERPGMTEARVWINNRRPDEAIPVTLLGGDVKAPVPVKVEGPVDAKATVTSARQAWEYRSVAVSADQDLGAALNSLGADGWEAVGLMSQAGGKVTALLKRPR